MASHTGVRSLDSENDWTSLVLAGHLTDIFEADWVSLYCRTNEQGNNLIWRVVLEPMSHLITPVRHAHIYVSGA